jgi:mannose-6-phosphate isomerase-like protein (cupin superfamily)
MLDNLEKHGTVRVVAPENAELLDVFGARVQVLSDGANTPLVIAAHEVPPGYGVPPHIHDADDELFYVQEGELTMVGRDGETKAGAGACVQLPRGVVHAFRNDGAAPARFHAILLPGIQALEMFRQFDRESRSPGGLAPPRIAAIAAQYGVRFA